LRPTGDIRSFMKINADFTKRVLVHSEQLAWIDSPMKGVQRRMLDRLGGEVARATSIVRYAPGSHFSAHVHNGGEEFIVLEGIFQDEHGDYPVGSYVRNPPQSRHTPASAAGCVIFVKLWQFDPADRTPIDTNVNDLAGIEDRSRAGVTVFTLFENSDEKVRIEQWQPQAEVPLDTSDGAELLVLDGSFDECGDKLVRHSWLRLPAGGAFRANVGIQGARVWIKTGCARLLEPPTRSAG
jgi:quercetin dioxygenase-like cupin family protein